MDHPFARFATADSLDRRGWPEPKRVECVSETVARGHRLRWLRFRRHRRSGRGRQGVPWAFGFQLEFAEPVTGPLALGYGAHFGLGQFVAEG